MRARGENSWCSTSTSRVEFIVRGTNHRARTSWRRRSLLPLSISSRSAPHLKGSELALAAVLVGAAQRSALRSAAVRRARQFRAAPLEELSRRLCVLKSLSRRRRLSARLEVFALRDALARFAAKRKVPVASNGAGGRSAGVSTRTRGGERRVRRRRRDARDATHSDCVMIIVNSATPISVCFHFARRGVSSASRRAADAAISHS